MTARTILVVDDRPINLRVMQVRLAQAGHRVLAAGEGRSALALLAAWPVDLVLLDAVMPGLSGIDVLLTLRRDPATAALPVIVVTGRSEPSAAVEALAAGADDWIAKPFSFDLLIARIDRVLARAAKPGTAREDTGLLASVQALQLQVARLEG
ncbi:Response regulator receiver domain-containing protein [Sphingomonas guangdongensis]|uniref:Response regulator receiver domain-containing protein n=1 Tax=Sphingomonas guangdongensis TaxID=1141890 RepID=A0A285QF70_9SPHN|nr:response regulator [Sphingomonas guangdongensis]SOB80134.1 Response regulator receiver domain-containing protein [Sphingomonas guangdongensis]